MLPFLASWICISNVIQLESVNAKRKQYEFSLLQMRTMVKHFCGIVFHFSFYMRFFHSCDFFFFLFAKSLSKINLSVFLWSYFQFNSKRSKLKENWFKRQKKNIQRSFDLNNITCVLNVTKKKNSILTAFVIWSIQRQKKGNI